jgi:endonuclease III
MATPHSLVHALALLKQEYGVVKLPEPRTPFALIVWENCAYLVDDEQHAKTFSALRKGVGITPKALLGAGSKRIEEAIAGGGMQPSRRAAKVLHCAELAMEFAGGNLGKLLPTLDEKPRRRLLKRFSGIADPGADKVLLLCGLATNPTLDSNGLRVLHRLGLVKVGEDRYAAAYAEGVGILRDAGIQGEAAIEAFALLREHGRKVCKRTRRACPLCPLRVICPSAL